MFADKKGLWAILHGCGLLYELRDVMTLALPEKFQRFQIDKRLDASGLHCPLPLLKARQALRELQAGETLLVVATDAGSWRDFAAFSEQSGHTLLEAAEIDAVYYYLLRHRA